MNIVSYFQGTDKQNFVSNIEEMVPRLSRKFYDMKLANTDVFALLEKAQNKQINIKLQGATGSGKTTIFEAYCEKTYQPHYVSNMKGSTTTEELIGAFVPNEDPNGGPYVWKDGVIVRALRYSNMTIEFEGKIEKDNDGNETHVFDKIPSFFGIDMKDNKVVDEDIVTKMEKKIIARAWPRCMLTIEEINFSPEELMSVWFSILDIRRNLILNEKNGEVIKAGKFLSVNATMNPDYIGTNPLNEALNDRFTIKLNVEYDKKVENLIINEVAKKHDFFMNDVGFIKKFVIMIRKGNLEGQCTSNISTRMIEAYLNIKGDFGDDVARESLFNAFNDEDRNYVKEMYDLAKSETDTVDLSAEEMEGIDLQNFKGYKPPQKQATKKKRTSTVECPF